MKQTVVEFLVEEISFLKDMNFDFGDGLPKDIINKATEMEKEENIKAQLECLNRAKDLDIQTVYNELKQQLKDLKE